MECFEKAREFLQKLESHNLLKPAVWAEDQKQLSYGVSVGVGLFVRPLYLYKKLSTLKDGKNAKGIPLGDVKAFTIKYTEDKNVKNTQKSPCLTCQCCFGFTSQPMIGNCAEYDVIGMVSPNSLGTDDDWGEFKVACEAHFSTFNEMNQQIMSNEKTPYKIIEEYFGKTYSSKPKVLSYAWDSETKGYKVIVMHWPK